MIQGESNLHQIVVTVLCRLRPPSPLEKLALFQYWKTPFPVLLFPQDLLYESTVFPHREIGGKKRRREMVALNSVHVCPDPPILFLSFFCSISLLLFVFRFSFFLSVFLCFPRILRVLRRERNALAFLVGSPPFFPKKHPENLLRLF